MEGREEHCAPLLDLKEMLFLLLDLSNVLFNGLGLFL